MPAPDYTLHVGSNLIVLPDMAPQSVQTIVTSPPYYGLRNYEVQDDNWPEISFSPMPGLPPVTIPAWKGNLGLESDPWAYIGHLVHVFRLARRVLADDGVLWLNLGDTYARTGGTDREASASAKVGSTRRTREQMKSRKQRTPEGLKEKDLMGIPWRVAFALQADGWFLRQDVIWAKGASGAAAEKGWIGNAMPESVTDRCVKAHEYVFMLTKSKRYFFDHVAIREAGTGRAAGNRSHKYAGAYGDGDEHQRTKGGMMRLAQSGTKMRNRRDVWTINAQPYKSAHFATFGPALVEPCIKAATSEVGHCPDCGARWARKRDRVADGSGERKDRGFPNGPPQLCGGGHWSPVVYQESGWVPTCECGQAPVPDVAMDLFGGSGTVAGEALRQGRDAVIIEVNPNYAELVPNRVESIRKPR